MKLSVFFPFTLFIYFFLRSLTSAERRHCSVGKEAYAIIMTGKHFTLATDQKSVSFMFDGKHKGRIKN